MKGGGLPRVVGGNTHTFHPCERTLLVLPIWPIYPINSLPLGGVVGLSTPGNFAIYSAQMISSPLEGNTVKPLLSIQRQALEAKGFCEFVDDDIQSGDSPKCKKDIELFGVSTIEQFGDWFSKVITIPSVVAMYPAEFTPRDRGCLSTNRIALFPEPIVLRPMTFGHLFSGRWGMISQYYVSNIVQSKVTKPNALSSLSVLHMRYISLIPSGTYDSTRVALPTVELAPKKAPS
ncbi:hypothetical protein FXO37_21893 [Capsicum annuum]|nr:hypothetical protein FXO37_21893 [Capsicum annuum]